MKRFVLLFALMIVAATATPSEAFHHHRGVRSRGVQVFAPGVQVNVRNRGLFARRQQVQVSAFGAVHAAPVFQQRVHYVPSAVFAPVFQQRAPIYYQRQTFGVGVPVYGGCR